MTHDPLCERPNGPNFAMCYCDVIARVREDEGNQNIGTVSLGELAKAQEDTFNAGYATALRDAVEAIKALCDCPVLDGKHASFCSIQDVLPAVTAIEALGAER